MDMPESDPETQVIMRQTDKFDGLPLITSLEEDDHSLSESLLDKVNREYIAQINRLQDVAVMEVGVIG